MLTSASAHSLDRNGVSRRFLRLCHRVCHLALVHQAAPLKWYFRSESQVVPFILHIMFHLFLREVPQGVGLAGSLLLLSLGSLRACSLGGRWLATLYNALHL